MLSFLRCCFRSSGAPGPARFGVGPGALSLWACAALLALPGPAALAQKGAAPAAVRPAAAATPLPSAVEAALLRAKVPLDAVSFVVVDAEGRQAPRLAWRAQEPMNPASVMKLVTTYAALELLGPAFTWDTPVYLDARPQGGSLRGNVYIKGVGDPQLVVERLWLMLRRLQAQGVQVIVGDIVLDRSAFDLPAHDAAVFDGEPLRPYNAAPDALLVNFKSVALTFVPDTAAGVARVQVEPPLAGAPWPATVPLAAPGAECGDWRTALKPDWTDPARVAFQGVFPAACGERVWPVAPPDPNGFAARAIEGLWRDLGGKLTGSVREGRVPQGLAPAFTVASPSLAEAVRSINKYSNNVMTQQVFLTIALQKNGTATFDGARNAVAQWWRQRMPAAEPPVLDNGAGLSREARVSAASLARMLQVAWASPVMPELLSSLPIAGADGTLRRSQVGRAARAAHLKTGTLRDVSALAGVVHAAGGRRYVVVALANHPNALAARAAMEALVDWAAGER
ncbi:D-alanyl-D-alanine carboxypeptidase/D-alanyl-D-alanine endopeptidase [Paracidovorax konjaci]|uniref:D-alanyl-D-alanine carboxypeptidase / D-alanyl-D-alanine-endopeptidase (Penicillin-binding protein 4) n=1 Tax=Paracidovorax konjaci TaxID=32040 RepID=A0A1I1W1A2_9BURK|nr:D-alanyl-D-alanine carboxypeptidase/D-alanyl-D-alanine-endopeptidase [Paracidovorax konjaci]SFD88895.1 D-alanyl-D-alanine carboxypeptidase / D-alanyl-D-alanine-endopeptidase (penicillin-binding protein 4) [Paracidovorax konjaci]